MKSFVSYFNSMLNERALFAGQNMRIRDRLINVIRLVDPLFSNELKGRFEFTKKIADFVGILVRLGIVTAATKFIYSLDIPKNDEVNYYGALIFFATVTALLWLSVFYLFCSIVDAIISAWLGEEFESGNFSREKFAKGKRIKNLSILLLSLIIIALIHGGMMFGINSFMGKP